MRDEKTLNPQNPKAPGAEFSIDPRLGQIRVAVVFSVESASSAFGITFGVVRKITLFSWRLSVCQAYELC